MQLPPVTPLVSKIERTEIESKSQLYAKDIQATVSWYQRQKELKLKANHNSPKKFKYFAKVGIKDRKN